MVKYHKKCRGKNGYSNVVELCQSSVLKKLYHDLQTSKQHRRRLSSSFSRIIVIIFLNRCDKFDACVFLSRVI